jgi:hypothetical protein
VELNGWDDVRTILANPSFDFHGQLPPPSLPPSLPLTSSIEMPSSWVENSTKAMKLIHFKRDSAQYSEPASSFDWDHEDLNEAVSPGSPGGCEPSRPPPSALSSLPSGYWLHKKRPKNMNSASNSTLPKCRDRLLDSPFGDPKKILRIQQRKAREAKEAQSKARQQTKKKVTEALPSAVGREGEGSRQSPEGRSHSSLPDLPIDFKKQVVVAERLFGSGDESRGPSNEDSGGLSSIDQLTYEEKLTVMMLQIKNSSAASSETLPL